MFWVEWKSLLDRTKLQFAENRQTWEEDDDRLSQSRSVTIDCPFEEKGKTFRSFIHSVSNDEMITDRNDEINE
jgi:hypothetical protein